MSESISNTPQFNKSVTIDKCRIVSLYGDRTEYALSGLNLISLIRDIKIYEDIFTTTLSGSITFQDKYSLSTILFLDGTENLHLAFSVYNPATGKFRTYGTPSSPLIFSMYAQEKRVPITKGAEQFEIKLVSSEVYGATEYRISKTYKNQFIENIIQDVIRNGLNSDKKFIKIDKTKTPITITVPFITPLQLIKLLCMFGQNEAQETNYFFYETLDGFHFRSLRSMIREASQRENIPTIYKTLGGTRKGRDTDVNITADSIELTLGYDAWYPAVHGYFSSTTYGLDILAGACLKTISRTSDPAFMNRQLINDINGKKSQPLYPYSYGKLVNPTSKIFLLPTTEISNKTSILKDKDEFINDNMIAKTMDGRNREMISLQLRTIRVSVSGSPDLHAGDVVNIEYPSTREVDGIVAKDIASGRYLIVSSAHTIINNGYGEFLYETHFEAGTDSILLN